MNYARGLIMVLLLGFGFNAFAAIEVYHFDNPAQRKTFEQLTHELRCLVCQNENIADSNADLAADLRHQILVMLRDGDDKQQIVKFMVARYGNFVLYKPPLEANTVLLWFGPAALALFAVLLLIGFIRHYAVQGARPRELSPEERERIGALLGGNDRGNMS